MQYLCAASLFITTINIFYNLYLCAKQDEVLEDIKLKIDVLQEAIKNNSIALSNVITNTYKMPAMMDGISDDLHKLSLQIKQTDAPIPPRKNNWDNIKNAFTSNNRAEINERSGTF